MTIQSFSASASGQAPASADPSPLPPGLPVLRFGLRQLFWGVGAVSLLLAVLIAIPDGPAQFVLVLAILVIAAHVCGTAIGSRLRRHADEVREWEAKFRTSAADLPSHNAAEHSCDLAAVQLPPKSPWYQRGSTALGWLPKLIVAGVAVGGFGGGALFAIDSSGRHISHAGVLMGAISFAVLGGWLAFLGGSFYAVFRHGLRDAIAHQCHDESRSFVRR
jgi:hypothetical protein